MQRPQQRRNKGRETQQRHKHTKNRNPLTSQSRQATPAILSQLSVTAIHSSRLCNSAKLSGISTPALPPIPLPLPARPSLPPIIIAPVNLVAVPLKFPVPTPAWPLASTAWARVLLTAASAACALEAGVWTGLLFACGEGGTVGWWPRAWRSCAGLKGSVSGTPGTAERAGGSMGAGGVGSGSGWGRMGVRRFDSGA